MQIDRRIVEEHNEKLLATHKQKLNAVSDSLSNVDAIVKKLVDFQVAIPKFDVPRSAPPVVLATGGLICPRHAGAEVTHRCTHCREIMCDSCVTRLRRRGGKVLLLCPSCSHKVQPIVGEKKKKRSLLGFLQKTVKMPFLAAHKTEE